MIEEGTNGQPETGNLDDPAVEHVLNKKAVDLFQVREILMLWITNHQPVLWTMKHLMNQWTLESPLAVIHQQHVPPPLATHYFIQHHLASTNHRFFIIISPSSSYRLAISSPSVGHISPPSLSHDFAIISPPWSIPSRLGPPWPPWPGPPRPRGGGEVHSTAKLVLLCASGKGGACKPSTPRRDLHEIRLPCGSVVDDGRFKHVANGS